jgi:hypothetical protein
MKRYLPYVFPAAALLVVVFLTYRWYSHNTTGIGQISEFAEGIEIEELSEQEQSNVTLGVGDIKTVTLKTESVSSQGENPQGDASMNEDSQSEVSAKIAEIVKAATGQVRYEIIEDRIRFSVSSTLPTLETGFYQVWLKAVDSDAIKKAFVLTMSKAGYMGSAAISAETLPFEVLVSYELEDTAQPTNTILKGIVEAN